jgi:hypothetical protein
MASAKRKDGRSAINIYKAGAYLGWTILDPPNLAASSG